LQGSLPPGAFAQSAAKEQEYLPAAGPSGVVRSTKYQFTSGSRRPYRIGGVYFCELVISGGGFVVRKD